MTIRGRILELLNRGLGAASLELVRSRRPPDSFTMDAALARARARGLEIGTILDVGASDGKWSKMAQRHFPEAHCLLFEPLSERTAALAALARERRRIHVVTAAAADAAGEATLTVGEDLDGSGFYEPAGENARTVPQTTVDAEVSQRSLPPPYLLKLDTHGYEVPILRGSSATLSRTALLVIEVYNFPITRDSLRFHEMCVHLEAFGFRCCDLADPLLRPRDSVLWQMDLFFAPVRSGLFQHAQYR